MPTSVDLSGKSAAGKYVIVLIFRGGHADCVQELVGIPQGNVYCTVCTIILTSTDRKLERKLGQTSTNSETIFLHGLLKKLFPHTII